jgi:hypothetical protein
MPAQPEVSKIIFSNLKEISSCALAINVKLTTNIKRKYFSG